MLRGGQQRGSEWRGWRGGGWDSGLLIGLSDDARGSQEDIRDNSGEQQHSESPGLVSEESNLSLIQVKCFGHDSQCPGTLLDASLHRRGPEPERRPQLVFDTAPRSLLWALSFSAHGLGPASVTAALWGISPSLRASLTWCLISINAFGFLFIPRGLAGLCARGDRGLWSLGSNSQLCHSLTL